MTWKNKTCDQCMTYHYNRRSFYSAQRTLTQHDTRLFFIRREQKKTTKIRM